MPWSFGNCRSARLADKSVRPTFLLSHSGDPSASFHDEISFAAAIGNPSHAGDKVFFANGTSLLGQASILFDVIRRFHNPVTMLSYIPAFQGRDFPALNFDEENSWPRLTSPFHPIPYTQK
jgi:hypothetical protein